MATKTITFDEKVGTIPKANHIAQVWDDDMNEIKDVVNTNANQQVVNTNDIAALQGSGAEYQLIANRKDDWQYDPTGTKYPQHELVRKSLSNVIDAFGNTGLTKNDDTIAMLEIDNISFKITANQYPILFYNGATLDDQYKLFPEIIVPLTAIPGLVTDGIYFRYVAYDINGTVVFSNTNFSNDRNYCQIGRLTVKRTAGVVTFLDTVPSPRNIKTTPDISGYNDLQRLYSPFKSNLTILPNASMTMKHAGGLIEGISIDWGDVLPNSKTILSANPFSFSRISPLSGQSPTPPPIVTTLVVSDYFNGTAVVPLAGNNNASVQRVLINDNGNLFVQMGEFQYDNFEDAKATVSTAPFSPILPSGSFTELCRIVAVKNATNLADTANVVFYVFGGASGGGSAASTGTNLSYTASTTIGTVLSDTGTDAVIPQHSDTVAGLLPSGNSTIYGVKTFDSGEILLKDSNFQDEKSSIINSGHNFEFRSINTNQFSDFFIDADGIALLNNATGVGTKIWQTSTVNITQYLPDANGTIALQEWVTANAITGTGTANYVPKFTAGKVVADSQIIDNGSRVLIGTTTDNAVDRLQVNGGVSLKGMLNNNSYFEKTITTPDFTDGVPDLAVDIRLGNNAIAGNIEVEITGYYIGQSATGKLTKIYAVGASQNGAIFDNESRVSEAIGDIKANISLGELSWDAANSTYRIPISHIVSTANSFTVKIKLFTQEGTAKDVYNALSLSSLYTLPALPANFVNYNGNVSAAPATTANQVTVLSQLTSNFLNEGNGIGTAFSTLPRENYGNIGLDAFDFSYSDTISSVFGATGESSFAAGISNISSGYNSATFGYKNINSANGGFTTGYNNKNAGYTNSINGIGHDVTGMNATVVGQAAEIITNSTVDFNVTTDIVFAVGNGTIANSDPDYNVLTRSNALTVQKNGDTSVKKLITDGVVRLKNYTVATLPTGVQGDTAYVTDALNPTYLAVIVGGGTVVTPVFYNGTAWVAH